jgi:hypothetical protein
VHLRLFQGQSGGRNWKKAIWKVMQQLWQSTCRHHLQSIRKECQSLALSQLHSLSPLQPRFWLSVQFGRKAQHWHLQFLFSLQRALKLQVWDLLRRKPHHLSQIIQMLRSMVGRKSQLPTLIGALCLILVLKSWPFFSGPKYDITFKISARATPICWKNLTSW